MHWTCIRWIGGGAILLIHLALGTFSSSAQEPLDYSAAVRQFEAVVNDELRGGRISGVSVAWVDGQKIVHAQGYGYADKQSKRPAQVGTVYRAGSISKLFTALAAMQLAEQGKLDIDAPLEKSLPDFEIINPFENRPSITLRQLMCHRSGFVRESPVGSYFDDSEPGTEATVASMASCVLVHPPNTQTKYSNSGVTVVGWAVSKVSQKAYEEYQRDFLLQPLGMGRSGFLLDAELRPHLAKGYLPVAQAEGGFVEIETPVFELGTIPAGNLYTTAEDLGRFLMFLFAGGQARGQRLIKAETLEEMFTPQLTGQAAGFGLGFNVGRFQGQKTVNHMGAVYGFTSALTAMPSQRIGVIVLCNDDIAIGPVRKLNNTALALMLEAKLGESRPAAPATAELSAAQWKALEGDYESESFWARIEASSNHASANISHQRVQLRPLSPLKFEANGRIAHEALFEFQQNEQGKITGFTGLNQRFRRAAPASSAALPAPWQRFIGSYGPDFIPVIITYKNGHLYAMTENEFDYRLTPLNQTTFKFPPGLYIDEHLSFQTDAAGRVYGIVLANMPLARR